MNDAEALVEKLNSIGDHYSLRELQAIIDYTDSKKLEIAIKLHPKGGDGFHEFRGILRTGEQSYTEIITYSDDIWEGMGLTYLKMCVGAGALL